MQFRIYDRQTLAYKDGGYIASYNIDEDQIANNNSTVKIVKALNDNVVEGDTIALIKTSGAYHKGTITTFDNADFSITYKGEKELFNDNMLNPYIGKYIEAEDVTIAGKFGLTEVASILENYFGKSSDWAKVIPLKVITDGDVVDDYGNPKMLWNWSNSSINVVDWLTSLFERYNVSINWTIDFDMAKPIYVETDSNGRISNIINNRKPTYIVTISAIINNGKIIKDNVANQTITYTEKELPEATVCVIIDKNTKEVVLMDNGTKNLLNPNIGTPSKSLDFGDYGTVENDDPNSCISGWIKITPNNYYTLSCIEYDGVARKIFIYDKNKNYITAVKNESGIISYNFGETTVKHSITFFVQEKYVDKNNNEYYPAYVKICYYKNTHELQFEQNSVATAYEYFNFPAIFYLINVAGRDMITLDGRDKRRVFPVKTKIVEYDTENDNDDTQTEAEVAADTLIPSKFNQAIEIKISKDSKMFDFETAIFGETYKIINAHGSIDSNYTGRREESGSKWITLYFGLGRQNYTDIMQARLRKARYNVVYNQ